MTLRIIYEPRGRALEYAPLAAAPYVRCGFGCIYCFNLGIQGLYSDEFAKTAAPRKDFLKKFEKDCQELAAANDQREILLSFSCDPYQPIDEELQLTRRAIKILIRHNLHFTILTKAGRKSLRDIDLIEEHPDLCRYGTTLTFWHDIFQRKWEPRAAEASARINALREMHHRGIRTWVSLEPVIQPSETLELILQTSRFVDEYRIGKFNHANSPEVEHLIEETGYHYPTEEEWRQFVKDAKTLLDKHGCWYIFKKDLQPYLQGEQ